MSLYSIAAASLTTPDDRARRPAIGTGQIARTLLFCLLAATALVLIQHCSHAAPATTPVIKPAASTGATPTF